MEYHYKRMDPLPPEKGKYLGRKEHGIDWSKNDAVRRANGKNGPTPQGKWGNKADLEYAGKQANRLEPGEWGDFPINSDHKSIVYYADGSESIPDMIRLRRNADGTFHGFPIDSKTAGPIFN